MRIGIDSGGTFTDFVILTDGGQLHSFKLRSNPASPATVILEGIERAAPGKKTEVVHGSTVATNALLERKGARAALVTTAGFEDLILIGRQNRPELYNLMPPPARPIVPAELCFGAVERVLFDGRIETPLTAGRSRRDPASFVRSWSGIRGDLPACIPIGTMRMSARCSPD